MIQFFWLIDFIGLFLGRLILSFFLFLEYRQRKSLQKSLSFFYLILTTSIFLGYYSSFAFIALIGLETFIILKKLIKDKAKLKDLEIHFLRIALAIVYVFVGPGLVSLDRIYNIRF